MPGTSCPHQRPGAGYHRRDGRGDRGVGPGRDFTVVGDRGGGGGGKDPVGEDTIPPIEEDVRSSTAGSWHVGEDVRGDGRKGAGNAVPRDIAEGLRGWSRCTGGRCWCRREIPAEG